MKTVSSLNRRALGRVKGPSLKQIKPMTMPRGKARGK